MAAKKVSLRVPSAIEVGNVDVEFEIRDGTTLLGTVAISRGGIAWRARGKRRSNQLSVTWANFDELMDQYANLMPPRARSARRAREPRPAVSDSFAIRQWAIQEGMHVSARGAIATSIKDAYYAAQA